MDQMKTEHEPLNEMMYLIYNNLHSCLFSFYQAVNTLLALRSLAKIGTSFEHCP